MKIKVGFFAILLFASILITSPLFSVASLTAAILHELGHLLAAFLLHIPMKEFSVGLFGFGLTPKNTLFSYSDEIFLCAAGPLTNLLFAFLLLPILKNLSSPFLLSFIFASFAFAFLNLLPIKSFDGGRIVRALLLLRLPLSVAEKILSVLSFLFIFSLWSISVYLLLRIVSSLSLFVFSISMFVRIFLSEEQK